MKRRKGRFYGRHRTPAPQDQCNPNPKPGSTGGGATARATDLLTHANRASRTIPIDPNPGGATFVPRPSLDQQLLVDMVKRIHDAMAQQLIYSTTPVLTLKPKPHPPLRREVVSGEIIGYRIWRLKHGLLQSVHMCDIWHPGEVMVGREIEDWSRRGVHAWKEAGEKYHEYLYDSMLCDDGFNPSRPTTIFTGTVFLWGDVVEHLHGYRAEYARVRSLDWILPCKDHVDNAEHLLHYLRGLYHV